jgi:H+/Cl- antiporter ClcA
MAGILGVLGGVAAWSLLHLIGLITNLALFHRWGWEAPPFTELNVGPHVVVAAVVGAVVISSIAKVAPIIRGHGIPEAMEAILVKQSRIAPRTAIAKPLSAAVAIGSGAPFGAEGPIIVTGGALGSLMGQVVPVSPSERKILLAAGAAAGMAATFGAPLAAVVLAIELLLFEFSIRAFIPLVVASSIAGGMHTLLLEDGPLFAVPSHDFAGLDVLPLFAILGLGAGVLATVITKGLFLVEAGYRRLPVDEFWHPVIGAVLFASIGLLVPRTLGVGYDVISDLLTDRLATGTIAAIVVVKLVIWWLALGSGTSGGTLAPILMISAGYGALLGEAFLHLGFGDGLTPGAFAVVAMAATFGAATRAPFAAIVFVFELTRDYDIMLPLMLATVLATLIAGATLRDSIMTEKLARRGLRVHADYEADLFRSVQVADIMSADVQTVPADATVGDARRTFLTGNHSAYPVTDDQGRCVAVIARGDLIRLDAHDDDALLPHASDEVVCVSPQDLGITALHAMVEEGVEHLPVVSDGRLVGICTRTDLLHVRRRQIDQERTQSSRFWRGRGARTGAAPPVRDRARH